MSSGKFIIKLFVVLVLAGLLLEILIMTCRSSIKFDVKSKSVRDIKAIDNETSLDEEESSIWMADQAILNEPIHFKEDKHVPYLKIQNPNQKYIHIEDNFTASTEFNWKMPYWNMTIEQREEFQQAQVDRFCSLHRLSPDSRQQFSMGRHMLRNDKTKTAFCFAPKVGCTNLKILFFLSQGAVPSSILFKNRDKVNNDILDEAINKHSFIGLSPNRKHRILRTYYKFIMYRNPIERLLSAFRSKIERKPLQGFEHDNPHYNWLKKEIFEYKHPSEFEEWRDAGGETEVPISFPDFVDYWLYRGGLQFDEHFQSIYSLCQPCAIRYDYYGNFDNFEQGAEVLTKHIESDTILLRDGYYEDGEQTSFVAPKYYTQLSDKQKKLIVTKLARDLGFYYAIFPSEKNRHKSIMDIDFDVPIFT